MKDENKEGKEGRALTSEQKASKEQCRAVGPRGIECCLEGGHVGQHSALFFSW